MARESKAFSVRRFFSLFANTGLSAAGDERPPDSSDERVFVCLSVCLFVLPVCTRPSWQLKTLSCFQGFQGRFLHFMPGSLCILFCFTENNSQLEQENSNQPRGARK